jgi:hypothetical protein
MRSETFTLHGRQMDDGRIYVTSEELHGFRLVVSNEASMEHEITGALGIFYPVYIAAKARVEAAQRRPRISRVQRVQGSLDLSAEFAFA